MKKVILALFAVITIIVVGFLLYKYYSKTTPLPPTEPPQQEEEQTASDTKPAPPQRQIYIPRTVTVTYTDSGYIPNEIDIIVGDMVEFKNESSSKMWPASDIHPFHGGYPFPGGCVDSTFDACGGINVGSIWPFKFQIVGYWGYHDELNLEKTGLIAVHEEGWSKPEPFKMPAEFSSPDSRTGEVPVIFRENAYGYAEYLPAVIKIKKGDTVVFKNETTDDMWPASDPHPVHTDYPTTGGCPGSTFDPCQPIARGKSWSFKFDYAGKWDYHDHIFLSRRGVVVVEE